MKVVTCVNQKGGVGKTQTARDLAAALAELGHQVLLVDFDPQGHLTESLGLPEAEDANLARALLGQWNGALGELVHTYAGGDRIADRLSVITTSPEMFLLEPQLYPVVGRENRLTRLLDAFADAFDFCVIDCPPSLGVLTDSALVAARTDDTHAGQLVIPVQLETSSIKALKLLVDQVTTVQESLRIQIARSGIVVNQADLRSSLARKHLTMFEKRDDLLAIIRRRTIMAEAWSTRQPVVEYMPDSEEAGWYRALARKVAE